MSHLRRSERINPNLNKNMNKSVNRSKMTNPFYEKLNSKQRKDQFKKEEKEENEENEMNNETCENNKSLISNENQENITVIKEEITSNEPMEEKPEIFVESNTSPTNKSAVTKALDKLNEDNKRRKKRKHVKIPMSVKRQKLNQRLSKILVPKSALLILHELKPSCVYKVETQSEANRAIFVATVNDNNVIIGEGQGLSKSIAKNIAAENAIKTIVSKAMEQQKENSENSSTIENLPWDRLASFAMFKMFSDWQNQGINIPLGIPSGIGMPIKFSKPEVVKRELPPNLEKLHPCVLLNISYPGLLAQELIRKTDPEGKVTMGYEIDGKMYTGEGRSKKEAKKEAAKAAIAALFGQNCAV